jgi:hypothetical protein
MPHPLDGPRLKVRRAKSEIDRLRGVEEIFRAEADYQVVRAELNPKTGQYRYRARIVHQPPLDEWGVWIGEIAHNLRSALDILVYELARLNNAPADVRDTQFPIFRYRFTKTVAGRSIVGFEGHRTSRRSPKGTGRHMISRLSDVHQARIERLQPYRRKGVNTALGRPLVGRWNLLYRLAELNNADKHRLLQVVGAKSGAGPMVSGWGEDTENDFAFAHPKIIEDGTLIVEAKPNMHVDSKILLLIAFAEGCEAVQHIAVCYALTLIANHVEEIIEGFAPDFG